MGALGTRALMVELLLLLLLCRGRITGEVVAFPSDGILHRRLRRGHRPLALSAAVRLGVACQEAAHILIGRHALPLRPGEAAALHSETPVGWVLRIDGAVRLPHLNERTLGCRGRISSVALRFRGYGSPILSRDGARSVRGEGHAGDAARLWSQILEGDKD